MKQYILLISMLIVATAACAQQTNDMQHMHKDTSVKHTTAHGNMHMMGMQHDTAMRMMSSQFSRDLPMSRDGSGTSWMPDQTPVYAYMIPGKKWMSMIHGSFFARYTKQDLFNKGSRGGSHVDAPNWLMFMTQRKIGKGGLFSVNTMFSFDPFLVGAGGYPLLYQTGESYQGRKLVDRQHPHDLFSELSVAYIQKVAKEADVSLTAGYPGEPALGPPVFMHRLSAINNPDAPLSHHYADATHITFGTATLGFRYKNVKLEGSIFTGREPNEHRYDFDRAKFDSYSLRLSYNPSTEWALQVSDGWLHSPEEAEPLDNTNRFTASAIHTKILGDNRYVATTIVYGQNHHSTSGKTQPAVLLESSLQLNKIAVYGRYEFIQKDAGELDLQAQYPADPNFNINAFTIGFNRILAAVKQTNFTAGLQTTVNASPGALKTLYGNAPVGFQVYLHITPAIMKMGSRHNMNKMMNM